MEIGAVLTVVAVFTIVFLFLGLASFVLWFFARADREEHEK